MTPRKFIRNIVKSNKRMAFTMLISNLVLFAIYVLVTDVQPDYDPSEHVLKYLVTLGIIALVTLFWYGVVNAINKRYSEILNDQIKLESNELAEFLLQHKVYKKCNIRSILEALDKKTGE